MSSRLEYTFNLSKDDKELINDLEKAETDGRLNDTIRNYLRLGQTVAIAAIFSTNVDSLQTIYAPLDSRINDITTLVNRLLNGATGSSTKGNIGEKILISHLSSAFSYTKGDQFRAKSTEGHSGDIEATMMIERSPGIIEPVLAIIGGAKISSKITIIESMLDKIDHLIIGGGMVYTFIYALKGKIGNSICEKDYANLALEIIEKAKSKNVSLHLPVDVVAGNNFSNNANQKIFDVKNIKNGWEGMDAGPKSLKLFETIICSATSAISFAFDLFT